jgi:hypothetical protein
MKLKYLLCLLLTAVTLSAVSQDFDYTPSDSTDDQKEDKESFVDKLYFGGGFGASFGNQTFINLSPAVFYKASERFHPGISLRYMYFAQPGFKEHIYGGSALARYFVLRDVSVLKNVYIHAEQEMLNGQWASNAVDRSNVYSTFLGGGALISLGGSFYMNAEILYRFNFNQVYNPYNNPVLRIGVIGGF